MEIAKRLNAIIAQLLPFLSSEVKHLSISITAEALFPAPAAGGHCSGEGQAGHHAGAQHHSGGE